MIIDVSFFGLDRYDTQTNYQLLTLCGVKQIYSFRPFIKFMVFSNIHMEFYFHFDFQQMTRRESLRLIINC